MNDAFTGPSPLGAARDRAPAESLPPAASREGLGGPIGWLRCLWRTSHPAAARLTWRCRRLGRFACAGPVQLKLHPRAIVREPSAFTVIGALIQSGSTPRGLVTTLALGDGATLDLDGATIGRGCRVDVGPGAVFSMGRGSYLSCESRAYVGAGVTIGRDCAISWEVTILDDDGHGFGPPPYSAPITIGDRVWIGCRATICKGVTIGDGSVVAAGAVVTRSCPPRSLLAGVPARVIRSDVAWRDP